MVTGTSADSVGGCSLKNLVRTDPYTGWCIRTTFTPLEIEVFLISAFNIIIFNIMLFSNFNSNHPYISLMSKEVSGASRNTRNYSTFCPNAIDNHIYEPVGPNGIEVLSIFLNGFI